jgi:hypothetical protein
LFVGKNQSVRNGIPGPSVRIPLFSSNSFCQKDLPKSKISRNPALAQNLMACASSPAPPTPLTQPPQASTLAAQVLDTLVRRGVSGYDVLCVDPVVLVLRGFVSEGECGEIVSLSRPHLKKCEHIGMDLSSTFPLPSPSFFSLISKGVLYSGEKCVHWYVLHSHYPHNQFPSSPSLPSSSHAGASNRNCAEEKVKLVKNTSWIMWMRQGEETRSAVLAGVLRRVSETLGICFPPNNELMQVCINLSNFLLFLSPCLPFCSSLSRFISLYKCIRSTIMSQGKPVSPTTTSTKSQTTPLGDLAKELPPWFFTSIQWRVVGAPHFPSWA